MIDKTSQIMHPRARLGIDLYNHGRFFEAHEELEAAWMAEPGQVRNLYRGILQVAVAYHHLERGNFRGARKMLQRSKRWLEPFKGVWFGIDIDQFKADTLQIDKQTDLEAHKGSFSPPPIWPPQIIIPL